MPPRTHDSPQSLAEKTHRLFQQQDMDEGYNAFGRLHDLLHPQLMARARRKMRLEDAEDMVEEAVMSLYQQLKTKECPKNVEAWVADVLTKRIADHFRLRRNTEELLAPPKFWEGNANKQKSQMGTGENPLMRVVKNEDPLMMVVMNEEKRQINVLLDNLPEDARTVFEAHYYEDLSWAEIAALHGTSVNAVKQKSQRALSAMIKMAVKRGFKHDN